MVVAALDVVEVVVALEVVVVVVTFVVVALVDVAVVVVECAEVDRPTVVVAPEPPPGATYPGPV